jgi:chemotaxis protein methyltransferase CheR
MAEPEIVEQPKELEDIEIELLVDGLFRYYGFDFREYSPASLKRRILNIVRSEKLASVSALQDKVFHDPVFLDRFLMSLVVSVSAMFRDPDFFLSFREKAVPLLRTYPFVRIWVAGCSMGEEVYSMAILLQEEGIYDRCRIYATDMSEAVLRKAREGIFPLDLMQNYTNNYIKAGGKRSFSEYYTAGYNSAIFPAVLKENIVFSQHNLVTDRSFNEFNVILCRNVMIYFNKSLQERVQQLLYDSLMMFGILGLGDKETLQFSPTARLYEILDGNEKLYRRIA